MQPYDDKDENIQRNFEETVRYKKKKQSDVSKIKAKSTHKHIKKECLFICNSKNIYYGHYCTVCGKITDWTKPMIKEKLDGRMVYRCLSEKEIFEEYKDLEHKNITDIFNKYISM